MECIEQSLSQVNPRELVRRSRMCGDLLVYLVETTSIWKERNLDLVNRDKSSVESTAPVRLSEAEQSESKTPILFQDEAGDSEQHNTDNGSETKISLADGDKNVNSESEADDRLENSDQKRHVASWGMEDADVSEDPNNDNKSKTKIQYMTELETENSNSLENSQLHDGVDTDVKKKSKRMNQVPMNQAPKFR